MRCRPSLSIHGYTVSMLDKLGVTGSSPVPPTSEIPAQAGFLLVHRPTSERPCKWMTRRSGSCPTQGAACAPLKERRKVRQMSDKEIRRVEDDSPYGERSTTGESWRALRRE
jgi:hypothetical protein